MNLVPPPSPTNSMPRLSILRADGFAGDGVIGYTVIRYTYPSTVTPTENYKNNTNWDRTETTLYHDTLKLLSGNVPATFDRISKNNAVHEIGHSIKLAHPKGGPKKNGRDYPGDGNEKRDVPAGQKSIMTWQIEIFYDDPVKVAQIPIVPQPYDRKDVEDRWGGM